MPGASVPPKSTPAGIDCVRKTKNCVCFPCTSHSWMELFLSFLEVTPDTVFLFGDIVKVDQYNHGWYGNAGFVVTTKGVVVIDTTQMTRNA